MNNIHIGSRVQFIFKGELLTGRVRSIDDINNMAIIKLDNNDMVNISIYSLMEEKHFKAFKKKIKKDKITLTHDDFMIRSEQVIEELEDIQKHPELIMLFLLFSAKLGEVLFEEEVRC